MAGLRSISRSANSGRTKHSTRSHSAAGAALSAASAAALCAEFGLLPGTPVVLTGTDQDPPLQRWWEFQSRRREIVRGLRAIGAVLSTTPNFSLFVDVPRHVDLHAIKRIGLVHCEFLDDGLLLSIVLCE